MFKGTEWSLHSTSFNSLMCLQTTSLCLSSQSNVTHTSLYKQNTHGREPMAGISGPRTVVFSHNLDDLLSSYFVLRLNPKLWIYAVTLISKLLRNRRYLISRIGQAVQYQDKHSYEHSQVPGEGEPAWMKRDRSVKAKWREKILAYYIYSQIPY